MGNIRAMSFAHYLGVLFLSITALLVYPSAYAQTSSSSSSNLQLPSNQQLSSNQILPCEALLCLSSSSGSSISQCDPALSAFYSINDRFWSDTFDDRLNWLKQCPAASENPDMSALAEALVSGSGRCDAVQLNSILRFSVLQSWGVQVEIGNTRPGYCELYADNPYVQTGYPQPVYIGTPDADGFWVEAANYQSALAQYQTDEPAKQAARQAAIDASNRSGGSN